MAGAAWRASSDTGHRRTPCRLRPALACRLLWRPSPDSRGLSRIQGEAMSKRSIIVSLLVAAAFLGAVSVYATARTSTAVHAFIRPADRSCIEESWGSIVNVCSTTKTVFMPVDIDKHCTVGSSWYVTAQSSSASSNVCCRMIGMYDGGGVSPGSYTCMSQFGTTPQKWHVFGAVLTHDRAFMTCDVGPGARILGFDWNPVGDC
jgi:hypothetical protein